LQKLQVLYVTSIAKTALLTLKVLRNVYILLVSSVAKTALFLVFSVAIYVVFIFTELSCLDSCKQWPKFLLRKTLQIEECWSSSQFI